MLMQSDFTYSYNSGPWNGKTPRKWQEECLPIALEGIHQVGSPLIRAATGSGKSLLQGEIIAELLKRISGDKKIVLTVPTQRLVQQMHKDLHPRLNGRVSQYYQKVRKTREPVIICCHASLQMLVDRLKKYNQQIEYWMADECHKTNGDAFSYMLKEWAPKYQIGFTATPFRGTGEAEDKNAWLNRWGREIYRYDIFRAVEDGCILPPQIIPYQAEISRRLNDATFHMIERHTKVGIHRGVVNATNIEDAKKFAKVARDAGYRTEAIHSKLDSIKQRKIMSRLEHRELDFVVYVDLLSEGVDYPWLDYLILRRPPAKKLNLRRYIQEVGRALRTYPGKENAYIIDMHNILTTANLTGDALLMALDGHIPGEEEEEESKSLFDSPQQERKKEGDAPSSPGVGETMVEPVMDIDIWLIQWSHRLWMDGCPACTPLPISSNEKEMPLDYAKRLNQAYDYLIEIKNKRPYEKLLQFSESDWNAFRWIYKYDQTGTLTLKRAHLFLYIIDCLAYDWKDSKPRAQDYQRLWERTELGQQLQPDELKRSIVFTHPTR